MQAFEIKTTPEQAKKQWVKPELEMINNSAIQSGKQPTNIEGATGGGGIPGGYSGPSAYVS